MIPLRIALPHDHVNYEDVHTHKVKGRKVNFYTSKRDGLCLVKADFRDDPDETNCAYMWADPKEKYFRQRAAEVMKTKGFELPTEVSITVGPGVYRFSNSNFFYRYQEGDELKSFQVTTVAYAYEIRLSEYTQDVTFLTTKYPAARPHDQDSFVENINRLLRGDYQIIGEANLVQVFTEIEGIKLPVRTATSSTVVDVVEELFVPEF